MATDKPMQLGMIGLGRMGANLVRRLIRDGHRCVVYDVNADAVKQLEETGATGDILPGGIRIQVGAATRRVAHASRGHRRPNPGPAGAALRSRRHDHRRGQLVLPRRHHPGQALSPDGIHYVDCGTSGGVWGLDRGYCLMIGGEDEAVDRLDPIFKIDRPRGRKRRADPEPDQDAAPLRTGTSTAAPTAPGTS